MRITYAKTAQVSGCPDAVLDRVTRDISTSSQGEGIVIVDFDNLKEYVEKYRGDDNDQEANFLIDVVVKIEEDYQGEPIGEVILVG